MRSVNITEEQFNAAKKSLILSQNEALIPNRLETLGSSFLYGSKDGMTVAQVADHCNNVTLSDVKVFFKVKNLIDVYLFRIFLTGCFKKVRKRKIFNGSRR